MSMMLIALLAVVLPALQTETAQTATRELLDRFKMEKVLWRQCEIGQALAAANNRGAIAELVQPLACAEGLSVNAICLRVTVTRPVEHA